MRVKRHLLLPRLEHQRPSDSPPRLCRRFARPQPVCVRARYVQCTHAVHCVLCTVYPMHVPRTELLAAVKGRNLCMCTVCLYPPPQPPSPSLSYLHRPEHGVIENALRVGPVSYCQNLVSLSVHTLVLSASCYTSRAYVDISTRHAMCVRHSGCGCQRPVS